tara:strand:- start:32 stop:352 length:321 start_codon:yes stop_codon:yes gene_type:complete
MTFLATLRHDHIEAPWIVSGQINAKAFHAYVETQLVKALRPGDIVVLDNLGSHKGEAVRRAIRAAGARLGDWCLQRMATDRRIDDLLRHAAPTPEFFHRGGTAQIS